MPETKKRGRPRRAQEKDSEAYQKKLKQIKSRQRAIRSAHNDIRDLPKVVNPRRKQKAKRSYKFYCNTYHPLAFDKGWSPDHERVGTKIERAAQKGGLFAMAMPRGQGKTTLCIRAVMWASLFALHRYCKLICAEIGAAKNLLKAIKMELETNELLLEDFPEICHPIRSLGRSGRSAELQTYKGEYTSMTWETERIILPHIKGRCKPVVIEVDGITGSLRGANLTLSDGQSVRPSLVVLDDPQTRKTAESESQSRLLERIVSGDILGLAGPGHPIAALMPCTVIKSGDMADRMLDREKHPDWQGEKAKLIYEWPDNIELWEKYRDIRAESLRNDGDGSEALEFYKKNRKAMDKGAKVAWKDRFDKASEISALQHAMNHLYQKGEEAFFAEFQNDPRGEDEQSDDFLTAEEIMAKMSLYDKRVIPSEATRMTAFIDVQMHCLYYILVAWNERFDGWIIDYNTWPDQKSRIFRYDRLRYRLLDKYSDLRCGWEAAIYAGLQDLTKELCARTWTTDETNNVLRVEKCLIDANWGESRDLIYQFCRESQLANIHPSHGRFISASSMPISEYRAKKREIIGDEWYLPVPKSGEVRHVVYDTNRFKTFVHSRFATSAGDRGCLQLFKAGATTHEMFANHMNAEYPIKT